MRRIDWSYWVSGIVLSLVMVGTLAAQDVDIVGAKALSKAFRRASERSTPAVVTVVAKTKPRSPQELRELLRDPRFKDLFPDGQIPFELPEDGEVPELNNQVGSGVIVDATGVILTNNHVVEDADSVLVRLSDGRELTATEIKTDPMSDIAVLKVAAGKPLPTAAIGDSSKLEIGDWVIAIGSPFELESTVSAGIISGKGRGIEKIRRGRLLQTDAAINPGNSGGPLVNLDGEVIGINTAIATSSGGYQGIGFAIPIDRAKWVMRELLTQGAVRRAYLGIRIGEMTAANAEKLKLATRSGVLVVDVVPGSPAEEAGMKRNDVIVDFAGEPVRAPRDLQDVAEQKDIGSKQPTKVIRDGQPLTLQVVMKALPQEPAETAPPRRRRPTERRNP